MEQNKWNIFKTEKKKHIKNAESILTYHDCKAIPSYMENRK